MKNKSGFTLIELIVIISISVIFTGTFLSRYNNYSGQLKLRNEAKMLIDVLELAKKKATSSDLIVTPLVTPPTYCTNFKGYRVTLTSATYLLKFGCSSSYSTVQTYNLPTNITAIVGIGNFDFPPLMINPIFNSVTITLKNTALNKCIDINISSIGVIELNETLTSC